MIVISVNDMYVLFVILEGLVLQNCLCDPMNFKSLMLGDVFTF